MAGPENEPPADTGAAGGPGAPARAAAAPDAAAMQVSARNRLEGTVIAIAGDGLLCEVTLRLAGGQEVVAVITRSSLERLGIAVGEPALALIKSTEVMLAR
jgi:molybdopterin-binding protein